MARHKHVGDGKEVVGELALGIDGGRRALSVLTVNHDDPARVLFAYPFDHLEAEATQSVFVGYHNRADFAAVDSFQKPLESTTVPVESTRDVRDDLDGIAVACRFLFTVGRSMATRPSLVPTDDSLGDATAQVGNLSIEVGALVGTADASISDRGSGIGGRFSIGVDTKVALDVIELVEALAPLRHTNESNLA